MSASLRLLRIEARRSLGLWALPVMAGLAWWVATTRLPGVVTLWPEVSISLRWTLVFIGPLTAAAAAWMAGRERRRGAEELLATTPRPLSVRQWMAFAGTAVWGIGAYALIAAVLLGIGLTRSTWGGPHWPTVLIGIIGIVASGGIGFALGYLVPSRLTAPLLAMALFYGQLLMGDVGFLRFLSPLQTADLNVFQTPYPSVALPQALWFAGLTGLALTAVALKSSPRRGALAMSVPLAAATTVVAIVLAQTGTVAEQDERVAVAYESVCEPTAEGIPVCVHPAYRGMLVEIVPLLHAITSPFIGLPNGPRRIEQHSGDYRPGTLSSDGTLTLALFGGRNGFDSIVFYASRALVGNDEGATVAHEGDEFFGGENTEVQFAIQRWLFQQAGHDPRGFFMGSSGGPEEERIAAAVARFDALEPEARRAWLAENFAALRNGELTLEDLP